MGYADATTKSYTKQNHIFADAFNFYLYGGKQMIKPEQLHELDVEELSILPGADRKGNRKGEAVQKYRDVLKRVTAMEDGKAAYLLLGIENQSAVHYAAPVRNLLYDALQYARQIEETAKNHRESGDYRGRREGEFLSGFYRDDKLIPVITLIILFSPDEWDGPRSLRDMMDVKDPELLEWVPDYPIHLVSPWELTADEMKKFHTSLGDVLTFIKYAGSEQKMVSWLEEEGANVRFGHQETEVLNACVNAKIKVEEDKEAVIVCEAIDQMIRKAEERAEERNTMQSIKNLMANLHWTAEQAASALGISEEEQEALLRKLPS